MVTQQSYLIPLVLPDLRQVPPPLTSSTVRLRPSTLPITSIFLSTWVQYLTGHFFLESCLMIL